MDGAVPDHRVKIKGSEKIPCFRTTPPKKNMKYEGEGDTN